MILEAAHLNWAIPEGMAHVGGEPPQMGQEGSLGNLDQPPQTSTPHLSAYIHGPVQNSPEHIST